MTARLPLAVSVGDPAGVGPRVSVTAALDAAARGESLVLFGDARRLAALVASAAPATPCVSVATEGPFALPAGALGLVAGDALGHVKSGTHRPAGHQSARGARDG